LGATLVKAKSVTDRVHCNIMRREDSLLFGINWRQPAQLIETLQKCQEHRKISTRLQIGQTVVLQRVLENGDGLKTDSTACHVRPSYPISDCPVISAGLAMPIMCRAVGPTSARRPPSRRRLPFIRSSATMSSTG